MNFGAKSAHAFFVVLFIGLFGIAAEAQRTFRAVLDGAQEAPTPVTATTATGTGTVVLNAGETQITVTLQFSGLTTAQTAAHIHGPAARGAATGVAISLPNGQITNQVFPITPAQVADLKAGLMYFNIHTTMFTGGEIRGQIEPDCIPPPSGMLAWLKADGNAFDQLNLHNGTASANVTYPAGKVDRAFNFNGTDTSVALAGGNWAALQTFSFDMWVNPNASQVNHADMIDNNHFNTRSWRIQKPPGGPWHYADNGAQIDFTLTPGVWHHLAVTRATNAVHVYVNGVLVGSATGIAGNFYDGTETLRLGDGVAFLRPFNGQIDEFEFFNRVLSLSEIQSIVNAGGAGKCPPCAPAPVGLFEWWPADGNAFGARDRNNGTLQNGATFAEGRSGHAFSFVGGTSEVSVPDSPEWDFDAEPGTLDFWVNFNTVQATNVFVAHSDGTGNQNKWIFWLNSGVLQLHTNTTGGSVINVGSAPFSPVVNRWYHIAFTRDASSNWRIYVDGVLQQTVNNPLFLPNASAPLTFGRAEALAGLNGKMDEIELGDLLSAAEIAAIVNAGRSCKCKPTATEAPANLAGWWGGDGNALDISGSGNSGTLQNGAGFRVGRVGQSFNFDGIDDSFQVPHNANQNISGSFTGEAWIFPRSAPNGSPRIFEKFDAFVVGFWLMSFGDGVLANNIALNITGNSFSTNSNTVPLNQWSHVAFTYNGTSGEVVLYINGVSAAGNIGAGRTTSNTSPLFIGNNAANGRQFDGLIDEPSIYNRVLTQTEIQSIFNAGLAGKLKNVTTPIGFAFGEEEKGRKGEGENKDVIPTSVPATEDGSGLSPQVVNVTVGDATVTFPTVTTAGTTQEIPLSLSGLPPLPTFSAGLTYDIATTAVYTGSPQVCFNLPSFTTTQFANLRVHHLENGSWVNRTTTAVHPQLCSSVPSLSPFAITSLVPTAANVSVAGRVLTADGRGISRARVTITDPDGVSRTAITNAFGYYRFDEIEVGRTYVVSARHKRYQFADRIVSVEDELTDLDFVPIE